MAQRSPDETELTHSEFRTFNSTSTTFIKREIPIDERARKNKGSLLDDPRLARRFFNEVAAYKLLKFSGKKPPSQFRKSSQIVQASIAADECRMPDYHHMAPGSGYCSSCRSIVRNNVADFVYNTVLPQLRGLQSKSTGLNGYVIPPRWVINEDKRLEWPVKTSLSADFVFVLHDWVETNILLDTPITNALRFRASKTPTCFSFFFSGFMNWCDVLKAYGSATGAFRQIPAGAFLYRPAAAENKAEGEMDWAKKP
ncbi:hypothetical protein MMC29_008392 [Sticta canariensis]|nr:hypothetical protein [Sticta canariensis]